MTVFHDYRDNRTNDTINDAELTNLMFQLMMQFSSELLVAIRVTSIEQL